MGVLLRCMMTVFRKYSSGDRRTPLVGEGLYNARCAIIAGGGVVGGILSQTASSCRSLCSLRVSPRGQAPALSFPRPLKASHRMTSPKLTVVVKVERNERAQRLTAAWSAWGLQNSGSTCHHTPFCG